MLKNLDSIGRLVIPKKIRTELGIDSETILNVEVVDGTIVVTPVSVTPTNRDND
jgi:AbrB family looped-hinge helix DNA binding protein